MIFLKDEDKYIIFSQAGNCYSYNKDLATDFSNFTIESFIRTKNLIEKKEDCDLEIEFHI